MRPGIAPLASLAALLLGATPARATDPLTLTAPLGVSTPGALRQLFLDPVISDARAVDRRWVSVRLESTNDWSVPTRVVRGGTAVDVQLDAQGDALVLGAHLPWTALGHTLATRLAWRVTGFWGGFEDGGIEAWHSLSGAYNFQRNLYPRDHVNLVLAQEGGPAAFDVHTPRVSVGDPVVSQEALLATGGRARVAGRPEDAPGWALAARADLKLPVGSLGRLGGSGGVDAALAVNASFEAASWLVLHGQLFAELTSGLSSSVALQPRTLHYGGDLSLVIPLSSSFAVLLEDRWLSTLFDDEGWTVDDGGSNAVYISSAEFALFRPQNQVSFGLRWGRATLSFSEDFTLGSNPKAVHDWFYDTNAPDTVLALTLVWP